MKTAYWLPLLAASLLPAFGQSPEASIIILLRTQPDQALIREARLLFEPSIQDALEGLRAESAASGFRVVNGAALARAQAKADQLELHALGAIERRLQQAFGPEQDAFLARLAGLGATNVRRYRAVNAVAARVPAAAIAEIERDSAVMMVGPDQMLKGNLDVSAAAMGAPAFWGAGLTGAGQSIALIDSGVDKTHPALTGASIVNGPVFSSAWFDTHLDNKASPDDYTALGHGTQMAGILAGQGSAGFAHHLGVARGAAIYNLKAAYNAAPYAPGWPPRTWMPVSDMLAAIDYAVLNTPAKILNISYGASYGEGGYNASDTGPAAVFIRNIVENHGVAIVVSAGSSSGFGPGIVEPANLSDVITVGAMDDHNTAARADDTIAPTSARGPTSGGLCKPDLSAPGVNVLAPAAWWEGVGADYLTMPHNEVEYHSTSAAAAHVSGALALLRQSGITNMLLAKAVLINSADSSSANCDPAGGWGYLNLTNARTPGSYFTSSPLLNPYFDYIDVAGPLESGPLQITLTTRTRFGPFLVISDRGTGQRVFQGSVTSSGVRKLFLPNGYYVIQLDNTGTGVDWALAINRRGFEPVKIHRVGSEANLKYSCFGNPTVALGSVFTVTCTVTNPGDVEAHSVRGVVDLVKNTPPHTEEPVCAIDFATIPGHGTRTQSCSGRATVPGPRLLTVRFRQPVRYHDPDPEYSNSNQPEYATYAVNITGGGVKGKVSTQGGAAVEGALLTLAGAVQRSGKTDASGNFGLYELPAGSGPYTITPSKPGFTFNPASTVVASIPADRVDAVNFVAVPAP